MYSAATTRAQLANFVVPNSSFVFRRVIATVCWSRDRANCNVCAYFFCVVAKLTHAVPPLSPNDTQGHGTQAFCGKVPKPGASFQKVSGEKRCLHVRRIVPKGGWRMAHQVLTPFCHLFCSSVKAGLSRPDGVPHCGSCKPLIKT